MSSLLLVHILPLSQLAFSIWLYSCGCMDSQFQSIITFILVFILYLFGRKFNLLDVRVMSAEYFSSDWIFSLRVFSLDWLWRTLCSLWVSISRIYIFFFLFFSSFFILFLLLLFTFSYLRNEFCPFSPPLHSRRSSILLCQLSHIQTLCRSGNPLGLTSNNPRSEQLWNWRISLFSHPLIQFGKFFRR